MSKKIAFKSRDSQTSLPPAETAGDLFKQSDIVILDEKVPEWGVTVHFRLLPADEGLKLNDQMQALTKENAFEAIFLLLGATLCNSQGETIINTVEEKKQLRLRAAKVLLRLQKIALNHQGWNDDAPKGSSPTELVASPSDSPQS